MYAITRRFDVLAPVLINCNYSGGRNRPMKTILTVDYFNAHT